MAKYDESMNILQAVLAADPNNGEANKYMAIIMLNRKIMIKLNHTLTR